MANRVKLASISLRIGLIVVFAYAAISSTVSPNDWIGYLPPFAAHIIPATTLLKIFSVYEALLVLWLASGKYQRYAGVLSALTMLGIISSNPGIFAITFRDVAIATGGVALALLADN